MARPLNPITHQKIVKNAKLIMHKDGYKNFSMRKVAFKSNMVVGNLYRYFESKEDLVNEIFNPVYEHIELSSFLTFDNIKVNYPTATDIRNLLTSQSSLIAEKIEELLHSHHLEVQIILNDPDLSRQIYKNVEFFLQNLIRFYFPIPEEMDDESQLLLRMFARAITAGFDELINEYPKNKTYLKKSIINYLSIFANLLEIKL